MTAPYTEDFQAASEAGLGPAWAQEAPKYDVLKKMYDDAVASLKVSQEAKNQLATKNEELTKQVAELQKQLATVTAERDALARETALHAERTYALRAHQAAWQEFLKRYPLLHVKWRAFLADDLVGADPEAPTLVDPVWPFRIEG